MRPLGVRTVQGLGAGIRGLGVHEPERRWNPAQLEEEALLDPKPYTSIGSSPRSFRLSAPRCQKPKGLKTHGSEAPSLMTAKLVAHNMHSTRITPRQTQLGRDESLVRACSRLFNALSVLGRSSARARPARHMPFLGSDLDTGFRCLGREHIIMPL